MDPIKNIVSSVIERMSSTQGHSKDLQAVWAKISGDAASRVANIKEGNLVITAASSMRLTRLSLNREQLLKELQKDFPAIKKIIFKVG